MPEGSLIEEVVQSNDGFQSNPGRRRQALVQKDISRPSTSKYEFRSKQTDLAEKKTTSSRYKRIKSPVIRPAVNRVILFIILLSFNKFSLHYQFGTFPHSPFILYVGL